MPERVPTMIEEREHHLSLEEGRLFAKTWTPEDLESSRLPPIILLHDSLGSVALWRGFPEHLAASTGRRVIAYDRLGFGQSDPHPGRLESNFVQMEARQVLPQLFTAFGVDEFVVCGHSVGGGMAVEAASYFQGRCRALITIAAQAFVEDITLEGIRAAQRDFQDPDNLARVAKYHGDKARWVISAWIDTWLQPEFANWNLEAALAAIRCPVLAIHGENDEFGSTEHPKRIAAGRGSVCILPEIGHVPHREQKEILTDVIGEFLESVDAAPQGASAGADLDGTIRPRAARG
jgi:pimeloyl-ACP methyl ester carboxylesterase